MKKTSALCFLELLEIMRLPKMIFFIGGQKWVATFFDCQKWGLVTKNTVFGHLGAKNEKNEDTLLSRTFKNSFLTFLTPLSPKCHFWPKTPFFATRGKNQKKIIMDSYVHYIYKDIVWYEILIYDIFMTAKNGGSGGQKRKNGGYMAFSNFWK